MRDFTLKWPIYLAVTVCLVLFSCCGVITPVNKANDLSVIIGKIEGMEKGSAKIYRADDTFKVIDSAGIVDGQFILKINVDVPQHYYVSISNLGEENALFMNNIFLGGDEEVLLTGERGVDMFLSVSDAPLLDESKEYESFLKKQPEADDLYSLRVKISEAYKVGDKLKVNDLNERREVLSMKLIEKTLGFKEGYKTNPVAAYQAYNYASTLSIERRLEVIDMFSNDAELYYINKLKNDIKNEERVSIGTYASDFHVQDLDGNEYTLDSFKGKYIFLEFSASWCGWCKLETPHIREAFKKFEDRNIVFITMNMDVTKELWAGTVKNDNIEWFCLSDLKGMNSELTESYNISGLPMSFVIDLEGKIIKMDVRGNEIIKYLSSVL